MNDLYSKCFKPPYPARPTLQQNLEVDEEAAEPISFIAVKKCVVHFQNIETYALGELSIEIVNCFRGLQKLRMEWVWLSESEGVEHPS